MFVTGIIYDKWVNIFHLPFWGHKFGNKQHKNNDPGMLHTAQINKLKKLGGEKKEKSVLKKQKMKNNEMFAIIEKCKSFFWLIFALE